MFCLCVCLSEAVEGESGEGARGGRERHSCVCVCVWGGCVHMFVCLQAREKVSERGRERERGGGGGERERERERCCLRLCVFVCDLWVRSRTHRRVRTCTRRPVWNGHLFGFESAYIIPIPHRLLVAVCFFVCLILFQKNAKCFPRTGLLGRASVLSHPVTVCRHQANQP